MTWFTSDVLKYSIILLCNHATVLYLLCKPHSLNFFLLSSFSTLSVQEETLIMRALSDNEMFIIGLFGLENEDIQSIEYIRDGNNAIVDVFLMPHPLRCPDCGYDQPKIKNCFKENHSFYSLWQRMYSSLSCKKVCMSCLSQNLLWKEPVCFPGKKDIYQNRHQYSYWFEEIYRNFRFCSWTLSYISYISSFYFWWTCTDIQAYSSRNDQFWWSFCIQN